MSFSKAFANCNAYNHSSSKYSDEGTISPSHLDHLTNYQQPTDNQATWIPPMEEKKSQWEGTFPSISLIFTTTSLCRFPLYN